LEAAKNGTLNSINNIWSTAYAKFIKRTYELQIVKKGQPASY